MRGAQAKDLPIEVPDPVLAINLAATRILGIKLPASLFARADQVIG